MEECRKQFEKQYPDFVNYENLWNVYKAGWESGMTQLELEMISYAAQLEKQLYGGTTQ